MTTYKEIEKPEDLKKLFIEFFKNVLSSENQYDFFNNTYLENTLFKFSTSLVEIVKIEKEAKRFVGVPIISTTFIRMNNVVFKKSYNHNHNVDCKFNSVHFESSTLFSIRNFNQPLHFYKCHFKTELNLSNKVFKRELTFEHSKFFDVNFNNVEFHNQIKFSICTFINIVTISDCVFKESFQINLSSFFRNLLVLFSTFEDECSIQRTTFQKGLDIANNKFFGGFNFNNSHLGYFKTKNIPIDNKLKGMTIDGSLRGYISTNHKRSTFRFIKQNLKKNDNIIDSVEYEYYEKKALFAERLEVLRDITLSPKDKLYAFGDLVILFFNRFSNRFKTSFGRGIVFTIIVSIVFFYLSMLSTERYYFNWELNVDWNDIYKNFFTFFNPVHKPNYLGSEFTENYNLSFWFYIFDFLGRIFVGYGIYQTIQAFRKYR